MNKKIIALVTAFMLLGSTATYALTSNYYANLLLNQKDQMKAEITKQYEAWNDEVGQQIHRDLVTKVATEREKVESEVDSYLKEKINADITKRLNQNTVEIQKAAEELKAELKQHIDDTFTNNVKE